MQYFEDVEVGTKRAFGRYEVTLDEVVEFARKYDPQPFHLSDEGRQVRISGGSRRAAGTPRR